MAALFREKEEELRARLKGRRMVFELGLSKREHSEISEMVADCFRRNSLRWAWSLHPALLATFLVGEGIFSWSGHKGYWPHVLEAARLSRTQTNQSALGTGFEDSLKVLRLQSFDDLIFKEGALRFVSHILIHGGVPVYSLVDFFTLLEKEIERGAGDAFDLLGRWRAHHTVFTNIDRPIQRFVLWGGEYARNLLDRCIELSGMTGTVGERAAELELPDYFVTEYDKYRRQRGAAVRPVRSRKLPRPHVEIDPWDALGPVVRLPAVDRVRPRWHVTAGSAGLDLVLDGFQDQTVSLPRARAWEVTLEAADSSPRTWVIECFGDVPVLFFDPVNGYLVQDWRSLTMDAVWVLSSSDVWSAIRLLNRADGSPLRCLEKAPPLSGDWHGFRLDCYELEDVGAFYLEMPGDGSEVVHVAKKEDRPQLVGILVPGVLTDSGTPVYAQHPTVQLPASYLADENQWRVRYQLNGQDLMVASLPASRLAEALSSHAPVGERALGEYELSLRGALGQDFKAAFAVVPGLAVERPENVVLPDDKAVRITVRTAHEIVVAADQKSSGISLLIPDDRNDVACAFDNGAVHLPVHIRAPRLLWRLLRAGQGANFGTRVIQVDVDDLDSPDTLGLMILTGRKGTRLLLRLVDAHGVQVQMSDPALTASEDGRWTFDLAPFKSTMRDSLEPTHELHLLVDGADVQVCRMVTGYRVGKVEVVSRVVGDFTSVHATFTESARLRGRVARLWSLDRPWAACMEQMIEDGTGGSVELGGYELIPPGRYRLEFAVDDGWTSIRRPAFGATNTFDFLIGDVQQRRDYIQALSPAAPLEMLELAVCGSLREPELDGAACRQVAAEALVAANVLLDDNAPGARPPWGFTAVVRILLEAGAGAISALARVVSEGKAERRQLLRVLVHRAREVSEFGQNLAEVARQIDEDVVRSVWRASPAWGSFVDLPRWHMDPDAAARCQQFLSWKPGEEEISTGPAITQMEASKKPGDLYQIKQMMDLIPQGLLHRDQLLTAYFEGLIGGRSDSGPSSIEPEETPAAAWWHRQRWLSTEANSILSEEVRHQLGSRQPQKGVLSAAWLPYGTLAAACVALSDDLADEVCLAARLALDEALVFAPTLVEHDLVVALVVTSGNTRGAPC